MKPQTEHTAENQLIDELRKGSHRAFDTIYRMYSKRLYAYSLQFTKSPEEAEEIVQEVFLRLWTHRAAIRQDVTLRSLLFVMAKHHLINSYRQKLNAPEYEEYVEYIHALPAEEAHSRLEYQEFLARLRRIMQTLPATQQRVIRLSRIEGLSHKEIAEKLSLSEQTVKNQLSLGLKTLREKMDKLLWLFLLLFY